MSKSLVQVLKDFCGVKYSYGAIKTAFSQSERGMFERRLGQLLADDQTGVMIKSHNSNVKGREVVHSVGDSYLTKLDPDSIVINQFIGR